MRLFSMGFVISVSAFVVTNIARIVSLVRASFSTLALAGFCIETLFVGTSVAFHICQTLGDSIWALFLHIDIIIVRKKIKM